MRIIEHSRASHNHVKMVTTINEGVEIVGGLEEQDQADGHKDKHFGGTKPHKNEKQEAVVPKVGLHLQGVRHECVTEMMAFLSYPLTTGQPCVGGPLAISCAAFCASECACRCL